MTGGNSLKIFIQLHDSRILSVKMYKGYFLFYRAAFCGSINILLSGWKQEWLFIICTLYANILSKEPLKGWNKHDNFLYRLDLFKDELSSIVKI